MILDSEKAYRGRPNKGKSKYPIQNGTVLKSRRPILVNNHKFHVKREHWIYMWIMRHNTQKKSDRVYHEHKVTITLTYIPSDPALAKQYYQVTRKVQQESIIRFIRRHGLIKLEEGIHYRGNAASVRKYYLAIGLPGIE